MSNSTDTPTAVEEPKPFDSLAFIMAYEGGELEDDDQVIEGFQQMIDSGIVWSLQGSYGRAAASLIESGHCTDTHNRLGGRTNP